MSARELYVIVGQYGEYSDRRVWVVAVCDSEDAAKHVVAGLESMWRVLSQTRGEEDTWDARTRAAQEMKRSGADPNLPADEWDSPNDVRYHYEKAGAL